MYLFVLYFMTQYKVMTPHCSLLARKSLKWVCLFKLSYLFGLKWWSNNSPFWLLN